jgi:hypothetical protein
MYVCMSACLYIITISFIEILHACCLNLTRVFFFFSWLFTYSIQFHHHARAAAVFCYVVLFLVLSVDDYVQPNLFAESNV